ncbi:hypothetical protein KEM56_001815 [Ascosphaera pollenicola]|nr:hypothetical protein KEM56_001815 [Ascosphaera pollenicola]
MGLYPPGRLELAPPSPTSQSKEGQKMLIWGASSTTGMLAVQLALASGVAVVTVASKHNLAFVMDLGVTAVFDYNDPRNLEKIIVLLKQMPGEFVGAYDCIGDEKTIKSCAGVVLSLAKGKVVTNSPITPEKAPMGVKVVSVDDTPFIVENEFVIQMIWEKYIPEGLQTKSIKTFPQPIVIGKGLENIAKGIERLREGVSAGKVVVEL